MIWLFKPVTSCDPTSQSVDQLSAHARLMCRWLTRTRGKTAGCRRASSSWGWAGIASLPSPLAYPAWPPTWRCWICLTTRWMECRQCLTCHPTSQNSTSPSVAWKTWTCGRMGRIRRGIQFAWGASKCELISVFDMDFFFLNREGRSVQ